MNETKLCFNDVLLVPQYSELDSRTIPSISTQLGGWLNLRAPIISSPMDSITGKYMLVVMDKIGGLGILARHINLPENEELIAQIREIQWARNEGATNIGCAIGIKGDIDRKAKSLLNAGCNVICIDVAHGDHAKVYEAIHVLTNLKNSYHFLLMAGNICIPSATSRFADNGVEAIKIGVGPGAACTTRIITGFGVPQLSAIMDCYQAIKEKFPKVSIIGDGGIRTSGDMVKCLWAGADACMVGYMLAGTNATPRIDGKRIYRGMSSREVSGRTDIAPEGVSFGVADNGETEEVVLGYLRGIRSGLAMGGANDIKELRDRVTYVIVSSLSIEETLPKIQ